MLLLMMNDERQPDNPLSFAPCEMWRGGGKGGSSKGKQARKSGEETQRNISSFFSKPAAAPPPPGGAPALPEAADEEVVAFRVGLLSPATLDKAAGKRPLAQAEAQAPRAAAKRPRAPAGARAPPTAEELHQQFTSKLGAGLPSRLGGAHSDTPLVPSLKDYTRTHGPVDKLTPYELQILALKRAHPGILLMVECGYKVRDGVFAPLWRLV